MSETTTAQTMKIRISAINFSNYYSPILLEEVYVYEKPRAANNYDPSGERYAQRIKDENSAKIDTLIGQTFYLTNVSPPWRSSYYQLSTEVPVTNRGVRRASGWLGTTDNVHAQALGAWQVTGRSSTHLHLTAVDAELVQA